MSEWLRRQTRNLLGSACAGSNPAVDEFNTFSSTHRQLHDTNWRNTLQVLFAKFYLKIINITFSVFTWFGKRDSLQLTFINEFLHKTVTLIWLMSVYEITPWLQKNSQSSIAYVKYNISFDGFFGLDNFYFHFLWTLTNLILVL